jgi:tetratricopeptide (TPR) repeat protein
MRVVSPLRRIVLSAVLLATLLGARGRAYADEDTRPLKPEAKARFSRGLEYYKLKEYEAAISEFEAAFAIDPRFEILFAQAQAERLSGDCASAVVLYRRFLASDPPAVHAEAARASLDKCETALRSGPDGEKAAQDEKAAPATPPPVENAPAPVEASRPAPAPEQAPGKPFYKDVLGDSLAGVGLVGIGVGVAFYVMSSSDASAADDATTYSEHARLLDRAEDRRTIALVGLGAGTALVAGAVIRWATMDGGGSERGTQVAVDVRSSSASLIVAGTF